MNSLSFYFPALFKHTFSRVPCLSFMIRPDRTVLIFHAPGTVHSFGSREKDRF